MHSIRVNNMTKLCSACNLPFNTLKLSPCCRKTFCEDCSKIHDLSDVCVIAESRPKSNMVQSQILEKIKTEDVPINPKITMLTRAANYIRQPTVIKTTAAMFTFFVYSYILLNFNQNTKCKLF